MLMLRGVSCHRNGRALLAPTDLTLPAGRFTAVLGPNGAGKSTLLSLIAGLEPIDRGEILLDGADLTRVPVERRARQLAMLTQEHPLSFPFSVQEVVGMGTHPLGLSATEVEKRVEDLMTTLELTGFEKRNYLTLSGGEKQRVQLARTLAQLGPESRLLLLDEPLTAMDLRHQHLTLAKLRRLAADGLVVVAVLHDPLLAARYADELVLLKQGEVKAQGDVRSLWRSDLLSGLYDLTLDAGFDAQGVPLLNASDDLFRL